MTRSVIGLTLRLRLPAALSTGVGLIAVMAAVGALFPAVGHSIGQLHVPKSVDNLLGGADYGTITGWFRSEIAAIYGPLVIGALAITGAAAATAGAEEDRILALVLAHPVTRASFVVAVAGAIAVIVVVIAAATWVGLIVGVALGGGGIAITRMAALSVQLACFGLACGALSLALAAITGRRSPAAGVAAGIAILGWLVNSLAPLVSALHWCRYLSLFYYYAGHDPLGRGLDVPGAIVLVVVAAALVAVAGAAIGRRDLRG